MKRIFVVVASLILVVAPWTPYAFGADGVYLKDKYQEALEKGCQPVVVKHTVMAGMLGILPGGGLFFTENYGGAFRDLLLWPLSVLWDPVLAVKSARDQNMQATVAACRAAESKKIKK